MDAARDTAPLRCHIGITAHGYVWLELVEVDSPDEYVSHELALPVVGHDGAECVDWAGARWLLPSGALGEMVHVQTAARLRTMQPVHVPSDVQLLDTWEKSGGHEARKAYALDVAI